jgi:hypothetical protein
MRVFFDQFSSAQDVFREFAITPQNDLEFIYAAYGCASYQGEAHVIFLQNGALYEVNDIHCSCNGLTNWKPEPTSLVALLYRPNVSNQAKANLKERFKNLIAFA